MTNFEKILTDLHSNDEQFETRFYHQGEIYTLTKSLCTYNEEQGGLDSETTVMNPTAPVVFYKWFSELVAKDESHEIIYYDIDQIRHELEYYLEILQDHNDQIDLENYNM